MSFPANQVGGQIKVNLSMQQASSASIFGGQVIQLPQTLPQVGTAFNSLGTVDAADKCDVLIARRYAGSDAGTPLYLSSATTGNQLVDVHGNPVRLARVRAIAVILWDVAHALDVPFTWTAGPVLGTTPKLRLYPKTAQSDSFFLFVAPDAVGYVVSSVSEQDLIKLTNVDAGSNVVADVYIAGIKT